MNKHHLSLLFQTRTVFLLLGLCSLVIGQPQVAGAQPGPVQPLVPAFQAGEVNPFGIVLVWSSDPQATGYEVQFVDTDGNPPTFAQPLIDEAVPDTLLAIGDWAFGGIYAWRVRATNTSGAGPWSAVSGFITLRGGALQVQLESPAEAAQDVPVDPAELTWRAVDGAASYHVQIATASDFSGLVVDAPNVQGTRFTTSVLQRDVVYHWRVKASNAAAANWSRTNLFFTGRLLPVAPTLLTPSAGATAQSTTPTLRWQAVPGVFTYTVQVARDTAFTTVVVAQDSLVDTAFETPVLGFQTVYYWRVRGVNDIGTGPWSVRRQFETKAPPPGMVTLFEPSDGAEDLEPTITLQWQPVPGAGQYSLQVGRDEQFQSLLTRADALTDTMFSITGLPPETQYFWRVRAIGSAGTGAWSEVWRFRTAQQPPADAVVLDAPANQVSPRSRPVQFRWHPVARAATYRLQVARDRAFVNIHQDLSAGPDTTATVPLDPRTLYFWRVRAENEAGPGPWSTVWQFQTLALMLPAAPVLQAPANEAPAVDVQPLFVWAPVEGVEGYRLEVTTQPDFATLALAVALDTTVYQVTQPALDYGTRYFWRVSAFNSAGTAPANPFAFTTVPRDVSTDTEQPGAFDLAANYPNPFTTQTRIAWALPEAQVVRLTVYDLHGREVAVLANGPMAAGRHTLTWAPADLPSGVYLYRITAGPYEAVRRMTRLQ